MDSLSQITLGAAVTVAVMGRRTAIWKAALVGGVVGTIPDLDAFINHGDAILNMVRHRAESHSLLYLTLLAPLFGWGVSRIFREPELWRRWTLALWLAFFTHPLLDVMTVYGTRLLIPFTEHPYGIGSIFIIDPLYTVPLLIGLVVALTFKSWRGLKWNYVGLALSTLYLGWGVAAQSYVTHDAQASLKASGIQAERLLVNPTAFNSVLWRLVAMTPDYYYEGFRSLLDPSSKDGAPTIVWRQYPRCGYLAQTFASNPGVAAIAHFSHGFYSLDQKDGHLFVTDLRMGQEPYYFFRFDLGNQPVAKVEVGASTGASTNTDANAITSAGSSSRQGWDIVSRPAGQRPNLATALPWLWERMWGKEVALPETVETLRPMQVRVAQQCGDVNLRAPDKMTTQSGQ
ncbi:metal-dependent hydrolase [Zwartia sp.]|uniref:metal-dependent hydrolase n=1 Tax=Zwartia sp. TaxID=2978004 RepID=UPI0027161603|nr:metal-dependent hydrolase [Zwartia sp.]MDO9024025.1 metal-dependent hydrolase [Zwartia sp.]